MDDLYKTMSRTGERALEQDEVTVFQSPSKGLVDNKKHRWESPTKPSTGFPSSNRDNVIDALKNIQDRIRTLELERNTAEENLKGLSKETSFYRQSLEKMRAESPRSPVSSRSMAASSRPSHKNNEIQEQLKSADARCELLDKQLDYMRKMLNEAEAEKRLAYERSEQMVRLRNANTAQEMKTQMEKIAEMERDHHHLQASQAVAQEKIRELERALEEKRTDHMKPLPNNFSSELRSAAQTNKILIEKLSPPCSPNKNQKSSTKHKKKQSKRQCVEPHPQPGQHYRLNMADIPFVVGQSTTPSHRVGSNVQNVIAMMKNHNKVLCASADNRHRPRSAPGYRSRKKKEKVVVSSTTGDSSESEAELQEMMDQLSEEYTHMSAEHHELTREMDAADSRHVVAEIQCEIEKLELRMNTKAEQIAKLCAHQNKLRDKRLAKRATSSSASSTARSTEARKAYRNPSSSTAGEVQVTTTIKTKGHRAEKIVESRPRSRQNNLATLNNMKTLKTRLKPNDLSWTT